MDPMKGFQSPQVHKSFSTSYCLWSYHKRKPSRTTCLLKPVSDTQLNFSNDPHKNSNCLNTSRHCLQFPLLDILLPQAFMFLSNIHSDLLLFYTSCCENQQLLQLILFPLLTSKSLYIPKCNSILAFLSIWNH